MKHNFTKRAMLEHIIRQNDRLQHSVNALAQVVTQPNDAQALETLRQHLKVSADALETGIKSSGVAQAAPPNAS